MNHQLLQILKVMTVLAYLFFSACTDVPAIQEQTDVTIKQHAILINQPNLSHTDGAKTQVSHGLLIAPELSSSLKEITDRRIENIPVITNNALKGGRYSFPLVLEKNKFAVASLRGVDFFEYDGSEQLTLFPGLQIDTLGDAWSIEKVGSSIWVADGYAGVSVWDMDTGEILEKWTDLEHARSFHTLQDGRVVVCRHRQGVDILSVNINGTEINRRIHIDAGERVFFATSHDNRLFIGTKGAGYQGYDIHQGSADYRWTYTGCEKMVWCAFREGIHYILDQDKGLLILEDQGDKVPRFLSNLNLPGETRHACFVSGGQIALANQKGIYMVNIELPNKPWVIQQIPARLDVRGVGLLRDNYLIVTESEYGIRLLELSSDQSQEIAAFEQNGLVTDVIPLDSTHFLVTNTGQGVSLVEAEIDHELNIVSQWRDTDYPVAADVHGSIVAIADYEGVLFLEISNDRILRKISKVNTPGRAVSVCLKGDHAYVSDWFEGVQIVDIHDISKPVIQSNISTNGWAINVAVTSDYAYVCSVTEGLLTVDISDLSNPRTIEIDRSAQAPEAVALTDRALYIADFNFGLIVFDLEDPAKPQPLGHYRLGICKNLKIHNNLLIVSNYIYGVKWFDISQPLKPVLTGELDTPGKSYSVTFLPNNNQVLVADWHQLLRVEW